MFQPCHIHFQTMSSELLTPRPVFTKYHCSSFPEPPKLVLASFAVCPDCRAQPTCFLLYRLGACLVSMHWKPDRNIVTSWCCLSTRIFNISNVSCHLYSSYRRSSDYSNLKNLFLAKILKMFHSKESTKNSNREGSKIDEFFYFKVPRKMVDT